jgi:hypothetical protein
MTDGYVKADRAEWEQDMAGYQSAKAAVGELQGSDQGLSVNATSERLFKSMGKLLDQPAPDIAAVIAKLFIVWADDLESDSPGCDMQRIIIGDLRRIAGGDVVGIQT